MRTLADAVSPLLAPYDPIQQNMSNKLQPPSGEHWFGTDNFGRDIFSRVLHGTGLTLFVGFFSVAIGATIGGWRTDRLMEFPQSDQAIPILDMHATQKEFVRVLESGTHPYGGKFISSKKEQSIC